MTLGRFLKSNIGEFVMLLISAWCLAVVAENAFFLDNVAGKPIISLLGCAVLLVVLYIASFERRKLLIGVIAVVVVCAMYVAIALALSTGEYLYDDTDGNYLYLALCIIISSVAAFLLTRTLAGAAIWFLAATFICSTVQAFYQCEALLPTLVALCAALALIIYRNFRISLLAADVARSWSGLSSTLASVVPVICACAIGLGVWFAVIAPLSPGVLDIKLITEYRQLPIVELKGVADEQPTLNLELTSDQLVDGYKYTTDDLKQGTSDTVIDAREIIEQILSGGGTSDSGEGNESGTNGGLDPDSTDQGYNALSYSEVFPWIIVAILIIVILIAAIVAFFMLRRRARTQRLRRMLDQEPAAQIESIYLFLLERLRTVGIAPAEGMTLAEFARNSSARMEPFCSEARVSFVELTDTYIACMYGTKVPTEEEVVPFAAFYLAFWKAARKTLGPVKYFFKSFRL